MQLKTGFVDSDHVRVPPTASGPLDGRRFAVKDVFQVKGTRTGNGHPKWRETHAPAPAHAPAISRLLASGAELVGKTHTDELTYSLSGQNVHYGTPPNPSAPDCVPGGSSSGSASVTAAGLVDFALGTDTGGSVRVPASFCGIYGIRPTLGAVSTEGAGELARSFDVVGWFARDAAMLQRVGSVLLPNRVSPQLQRVRLLREAIVSSEEELAEQTRQLLDAGAVPLEQIEDATVGPLEEFFQAFRPLQAYEAWAHYGKWITRHRPLFGPGVKERFAAASQVSEAEARWARQRCGELRDGLLEIVGDNTVLCMPTTPIPAPALGASDAQVEAARFRMLCMNAVAGTGGLPQLSLPLLQLGGRPVGLSLIGPPGSDLQLLELAVRMERDELLARRAG
ncbi:MAG: amidase [Ectothiorhodospiraceae bacterium]|nr:amidase [Ectothiorhodospiraceae bacterium]MCH8505074.1 amidase [Ectothiorhodospiraceae bacterium]